MTIEVIVCLLCHERALRSDGLAASDLDMQSSMRTLQGQQAFLEQVVSVAGSLTFQAKQAEALIATLRDERQMAECIRPSE